MQISEVKSILREEKLFTYAFEHAAIGMALVSPSGRWLMVNKSLCTLFGLSENEMLSSSFQKITHPEDLVSDLNYIQDLLLGKMESYQKEKRYFHKNGRIIYALLSVGLVRDVHGRPLFLVSQIQDITERKNLEKQLTRQAQRDSLTGICNRRYFTELTAIEISRMGRYQESAVFLMLDIDHFKKINDKYGHAAGDQALIILSQVCGQVLRPFDIFGRIGGEEFAILLVKSNLHVGHRVAERLREEIESLKIPIGKDVVRFTISIGGIVFQGDSYCLETLMRGADKALYEAKLSGRNLVKITDGISCFHEENRLPQGFLRLEWQATYECGNKNIDEQHKMLFLKANQLLTSVTNAEYDNQSISSSLMGLLADVEHHFATEERVMQEIGYPQAKQHAKIHAFLIGKAQQLAKKMQSNHLELSEVLQYLVVDVVYNHLLKEDIKFFPFM